MVNHATQGIASDPRVGPRELTFLERSSSNADLARILLIKIGELEAHISGHTCGEQKTEPESSGLPYTLDATNDRLRACLDSVERIHNRF